jgi:hypothetical protein
LGNIEKDLAFDILRSGGLSPSQLGLRFDRVVVRVLAELRSFVEAATPESVAVLVTISAPVRQPAKTVGDLKANITALITAGVSAADSVAILHGNSVRLRLVEQSARAPIRLIGFVHHPRAAPETLLDLAEQWLRARGPRGR